MQTTSASNNRDATGAVSALGTDTENKCDLRTEAGTTAGGSGGELQGLVDKIEQARARLFLIRLEMIGQCTNRQQRCRQWRLQHSNDQEEWGAQEKKWCRMSEDPKIIVEGWQSISLHEYKTKIVPRFVQKFCRKKGKPFVRHNVQRPLHLVSECWLVFVFSF